MPVNLELSYFSILFDCDIAEIMGVIALFGFLNRWNDSMGSALEDLPIEKGEEHLMKNTNWTPGKHRA